MNSANWKLIETAPRDGTRILAWDPMGDSRLVINWFGEADGHWMVSWSGEENPDCTHWQDLPDPPEDFN